MLWRGPLIATIGQPGALQAVVLDEIHCLQTDNSDQTLRQKERYSYPLADSISSHRKQY